MDTCSHKELDMTEVTEQHINFKIYPVASPCCCCSDAKSWVTLCHPIDCIMPGSSMLHYLPVCSNSCPLSEWCYLTPLFSDVPFSFCLQFFPAWKSLSVSWLFISGGQDIIVSASASVLPINIQSWFPLGLTVLISFQSKWLSRVLQHHNSKSSVLWHSALFMVQFSSVHNYWKSNSFDYINFCLGTNQTEKPNL